MKWALNTYQTAQDWDVERIIEVCQATGYEGVEFLQDFGQQHGIEADTPEAHVLAVARRMREAGLLVASLTSCCIFHAPQEAERWRNIEQVKRVVDQAAGVKLEEIVCTLSS